MTRTPKSPFVIPVSRVARRRASKALNIFVQVAVVASLTLSGGFGVGVNTAHAVPPLNPKIDLDQCRNGAAATPVDCEDGTWVNGNAGSTNSHYREGESIAYRSVMTDLPTATPITLTLGYDAKHSDKHAVDYLTQYDRTGVNVDPVDGTGVVGVPTTFAIPTPPTLNSPMPGQPTNSFNALAAAEKVLTLWNGTISSAAYVNNADGDLGDLSAAQSEVRLQITFTVTDPTAVLAWGGHIGSRLDWGVGNSAGGISGSPYHMRLVDWTLGNLGNTDRSLSADAIIAPPTPGTVTVIKHVVNKYSGTKTAADFTLHVSNGTPATFAGSESGTVVSITPLDTYSVTEDYDPEYYPIMSGDCTNVQMPRDGELTCIVTNYDIPTPANVSIVKTVDKATANPGDTLHYELTVTNSGDSDAWGIQVVDTLPSYIDSVSNVTPAATTVTASTITWDLATLAGHSSTTLSFDAKLNSTFPFGSTILTNTADLGCSPSAQQEFEVCPWNGSDDAVTTVTTAPVLTLTKSATPTTTNPLTTVTYTITWSVSGNSQATGVVLTDPMPTNVNFVSAANGGVYDANTKLITWNLGTKNPGDSGSVSWVGQVAATAPAGTIVNTASIDSNETDPVITATANIVVTIPQVLGSTAPDLTIEKSVDQSTANPGDTVQYTVLISNVGDGDATNVNVTDTLPTGFTYEMGGESTMTWNLGTIKAGESRTLTYAVVVGTGVTAGTYTNTATVTADDLNPRSDTADVTVKVPQVLGVADTGASALDYFLLALGGLLVAFGVTQLVRQRRTGTNA